MWAVAHWRLALLSLLAVAELGHEEMSDTIVKARYVRVFDSEGGLGTKKTTREQDNADGTGKGVQQDKEPPDNFASVGTYYHNGGHYVGVLKEEDYFCPSKIVPLGLIT